MQNWFLNKESEFYRFGRNLKEFISIHKYSAGNSNKILIIIRLKVEFACLSSVSCLVLLEHQPWPTLNWNSSQTFAVGCTSWFGAPINIPKFSLITNWKSKSHHERLSQNSPSYSVEGFKLDYPFLNLSGYIFFSISASVAFFAKNLPFNNYGMGNVKIILDLSLRLKGCNSRCTLWVEWYGDLLCFEYPSTHLHCN